MLSPHHRRAIYQLIIPTLFTVLLGSSSSTRPTTLPRLIWLGKACPPMDGRSRGNVCFPSLEIDFGRINLPVQDSGDHGMLYSPFCFQACHRILQERNVKGIMKAKGFYLFRGQIGVVHQDGLCTKTLYSTAAQFEVLCANPDNMDLVSTQPEAKVAAGR